MASTELVIQTTALGFLCTCVYVWESVYAHLGFPPPLSILPRIESLDVK